MTIILAQNEKDGEHKEDDGYHYDAPHKVDDGYHYDPPKKQDDGYHYDPPKKQDDGYHYDPPKPVEHKPDNGYHYERPKDLHSADVLEENSKKTKYSTTDFEKEFKKLDPFPENKIKYHKFNPKDYKYVAELDEKPVANHEGDAVKSKTWQVEGEYVYKSKTGRLIKVTYTADEKGYHPVIHQ